MKKILILVASIVAASIAMLGFMIIMGQMLHPDNVGAAIIKGLSIVVGLAVFTGVREVLRHM